MCILPSAWRLSLILTYIYGYILYVLRDPTTQGLGSPDHDNAGARTASRASHQNVKQLLISASTDHCLVRQCLCVFYWQRFVPERAPFPPLPLPPPPDDMWSPGRSSYGRGRGPVPVFVASATRNSGPRIRSGDMGERLRSRDRVFFSFFFFFLLSTSIPLTCLPVWTGMRLIICLVSQLLS